MASNYFESKSLNYTYINEDQIVEHELLPKHCKHVACVAGSGTRLIPFLAKHPKQLTVIDLSSEQLLLTQFRLQCLKKLSREDYMALWGYPGAEVLTPDKRKLLFGSLGPNNSEHFAFMKNVFEQIKWSEPIGIGKWERTFQPISKVTKKILGKEFLNELFSIRSQAVYDNFMVESFPWIRWDLLTKVFANSIFFNVMLYGKEFPKINVADHYSTFYRKALRTSLLMCPARQNFFAQILILGKVSFPEALSLDTDSELFRLAKESDADVNFVSGDVVSVIQNTKIPMDFVAVSDVPSYFNGSMAREWLQSVRQGIAQEGMLVARYYRYVPEAVDAGGWLNLNDRYRDLFKQEKTQMYTYDVLQKH